jgi:putative transposase
LVIGNLEKILATSTAPNRPSVGVDIGIKELAVASSGKVYSNPKAYRKMIKNGNG